MSTIHRPFADAVIVAAGSSRRMDGQDKLEVELAGRTVLQRATETMASAASVAGVVLVTAPDRVAELSERGWVRSVQARVVAGGDRRQDSVAAGVRASTQEVVLVHDGARPFVPVTLVDEVARTAARDGAAIPAVPVAESLKRVEEGRVVSTVSRDGLYGAQTPQGARRELLDAALTALASSDEIFGDEAEILARYGVPVTVVPGDPVNLKITLPGDLDRARALVRETSSDPRIGMGSDSHPFGPVDGLRLGGITIPDAPRLAGHSDGDTVLHAICDALLGAAALPDLGRIFPADEPATSGIDSTQITRAVVGHLDASGWRPAWVDLTITGARPRLGGRRLEEMRAAIASLLDIDESGVSVKASTGNLSGDEGAGRTIRADAIAGLVRR